MLLDGWLEFLYSVDCFSWIVPEGSFSCHYLLSNLGSELPPFRARLKLDRSKLPDSKIGWFWLGIVSMTNT